MTSTRASTGPPAAAFWDDVSIELNDQRIKKLVPELPQVSAAMQVVRGGGIETLAYLIMQLIKTRDKRVFIRALASATAWLLDDASNMLGSPTKPEVLTGLAPAAADDADVDSVLKTNFEDAEDVTIAEILNVMSADSDELAAYIGILYFAGTKRVDNQNRSAFNEKRKKAALASVIEEPLIFVPESVFLDDVVLQLAYGAFYSYSPAKAQLISRVIAQVDKPFMGPPRSFFDMFLLLVDSGMNALRIIKEAVLKHPWIRTSFPELRPELAAANEAQQIIRTAPPRDRSFLKAIHGNAFIPVNYNQIDNLVGVCKEVLKRTTPSYQNYKGGRITDHQLSVVNQHLGAGEVLVSTAAAE